MSSEDESTRIDVQSAVGGDRAALNRILLGVQDLIYGLSLRMLGDLEEARDATQEILLRVVTRLSAFRGESRFSTWTYRIASNALIDWKRREGGRPPLESLGDQLSQPEEPWPAGVGEDDAEQALLEREVYLGCSLGLLAGLSDDQRLAFILGEVLELDHGEASAVLEVPAQVFRKRLSRARQRLREFLSPRCTQINSEGSCRCANQVPLNVGLGRIKPKALRLVSHPCSLPSRLLLDPAERRRAKRVVIGVTQLVEVAELFRKQPDYKAPEAIREAILQTLSQAGGQN